MRTASSAHCVLCAIVLAVFGSASAAEWQCDGHWLRFQGRPVLLVGDSITQGWMELGNNFDQRAYLDALADRGINVLLLWSYIGIDDQSADERIGYDAPELWPWAQTASPSGEGVFDLGRFNDAYFDRLGALVRGGEVRGIVAVIQVHDGWTKTRFAGHPFNIVNGGPLTDKSQFVELHDYEREMPLHFDPRWTRPQKHQFYLERFCEQLIGATAGAPNVMFEIFNEGEWYDSRRLRAFQRHFLDFFKARTSQPLIINDDHIRGAPGFRGAPKADVLSHHTPRWDDLPSARVYFDHYSRQFEATPAKPMFFSEPVPSYAGGDAATEGAMLRLLWGTALAGASVVIQNDASYGFDPRSAMAGRVEQRDRVLDLEGHAARFFNEGGLNLAAMRPDGGLASTSICLADAGREYVVYRPPGTAFTVNLAAAKGRILTVRWYDPRSGRFHDADQIAGGSETQSFAAPFEGDAVLHLKAAGGATREVGSGR